MDTPRQRKVQREQADKESLIKYIEVLRSAEEYPPGDAWMSITDAARVTRTSEAMARRWVTSGRLPIKKGVYGIPPKTRLVRLSDVAQIRPIIDPTAAISDGTRKLDLPSIPRQQAQIMQDYQRILSETATLKTTVAQFTQELRASLRGGLDALEKRLNTEQSRLTNAFEQQFGELRERLTCQLEEIRSTVTAHYSELEWHVTELTNLQRQLQQAHEELAASITLQNQAQRAYLQEETHRLDAERQTQAERLEAVSAQLEHVILTIDQTGRDLVALEKRQQAALGSQAQTFKAITEQMARDFACDLQQLERDQAQDVAAINRQIESINIGLEQVNDGITEAHRTAEASRAAQESRISTLEQRLEHERTVRYALEQQLTALTQAVTQPGKPKGRQRRGS